MVLLVTLLLLAAVLVFVGAPLVGTPAGTEEARPLPADEQRARLIAEREHALAALKDLDLEHSVGTISDADYAELRQAQRHKALTILRELDRHERLAAPPSDRDAAAPPDDAALDARMEDEIARARQRLAGTVTGEHDDVRCPECGTPHAPTARFCTECGRRFDRRLRCPSCGAPRQDRDRFCAACGLLFEQERREI